MPVIEAAVAVGYVVAWALRKAQHAGGRLDAITDGVIDQGMDRLDHLIRAKLSGHPALDDLDEEAAAEADPDSDETVSDLTRGQLELSVKAALAKDEAFAASVAELVQALEKDRPADVTAPGISMTARASEQARIYQAGRDLHAGRE